MKEIWFKIVIWLIVVFSTLTWACNLITMPSTIANLFGIILVIVITYITIKTNCFTNINFKKYNKNEKNN